MTVRDIKKLVAYWVGMAEDDIQVAKQLLNAKRPTYALFFCHLAIEKMLKAVVVKRTQEHAPLTHNLPFLAGRANLALEKGDLEFLAEMTRWNLEVRYPSDIETLKAYATVSKAQSEFKRTEELLRWLKKLLSENL